MAAETLEDIETPETSERNRRGEGEGDGAGTFMQNPIIPQKKLQIQEETPRKHGDTTCIIVFDVCSRPVFSESLLGLGVFSGEFRDREIEREREDDEAKGWGKENNNNNNAYS